MKFLGLGSQKLEHEQDTQTDRCTQMYYHATLTGGNRKDNNLKLEILIQVSIHSEP